MRRSFELLFAVVIASILAAAEIPLGDQAPLIASLSAPAGQAAVWNGEEFFAVWTDTRIDPTGSLFGARIAADGRVLDPFGIALTTANGQAPQVAWTGDGYVVIAYQRWGFTTGTFHLFSWLLDRDGHPLRDPIDLGDDLQNARLAGNARGEMILTGTNPKRLSFVIPVASDGSLRRDQIYDPIDMTAPVPVDDGAGGWAIFAIREVCFPYSPFDCPNPTRVDYLHYATNHLPGTNRVSLGDAVAH